MKSRSGSEKNTKYTIWRKKENSGKLNVLPKACAGKEAVTVKINTGKERPPAVEQR